MSDLIERLREAAKKPLSTSIEGDELVIRIGIGTLAVAVKYDPKLQFYSEELNDFFEPEVTDEGKWAEEIVHALNDEEEDGTTLVHRMLDKAASQALESGGEGIVLAEDRARAALKSLEPK